MLSRSSASESSLVSSWTVLDSTLARSRMSLSSLSRSPPDERMTWAYCTWRSVRLPSGLSSSCSASTSRLLSGVRSSCDMLAMNSDLYFEETDSSRAFSSTKRFASSTSWYLPSTSLFLSASSCRLRGELLVGLVQLLLAGLQLLRLRLRLLEQLARSPTWRRPC